MSDLCLTLLCPPGAEEKLLDCLLLSPDIVKIFTSTTTAAHGLAHENLDQAEQVLGRARAIAIQVILAASDKTALLDIIRKQVAGAGVRYWVTTVVEAGELV